MSQIWNYWSEEIKEIKGVLCKVMICKVVENSGDSPCGKTYIISNETIENATIHLRNYHDITENGKVSKTCFLFYNHLKKSCYFEMIILLDLTFFF